MVSSYMRLSFEPKIQAERLFALFSALCAWRQGNRAVPHVSASVAIKVPPMKPGPHQSRRVCQAALGVQQRIDSIGRLSPADTVPGPRQYRFVQDESESWNKEGQSRKGGHLRTHHDHFQPSNMETGSHLHDHWC